MTRTCADTNNCNSEYNKPGETVECKNEIIINSLVEEKDNTPLIFLLILALVLIGVAVVLVNIK